MSIFDPTEAELEEQRRSNQMHGANFSFVTIPTEVKNAWRDLHSSRHTIDRLNRYARMTTGMKYDMRAALRLNHNAQTILDRFFATVKTAPQPDLFESGGVE